MTIGPSTETGFYYDFDRAITFTPDDLNRIEAEMRQIIRDHLPIVRETVDRDELRAEIAQIHEPYKLKILDGIPLDEPITRYYIGCPDPVAGAEPPSLFDLPAPGEPALAASCWWDLCAGPHLNTTGEIDPDAFALESVAGAYWRGDETKPHLQRIYGTAWETPDQLQAYLQQKEEAKRRDHRKLGQELDLFSIQEEAGAGWYSGTQRGRECGCCLRTTGATPIWGRVMTCSTRPILPTSTCGRPRATLISIETTCLTR